MSNNFIVKSYRGEYFVCYVDALPKPTDESFIVIDKTINDLYYKYDSTKAYIIDSTENSKTLDGSCRLIKYLMERGFKKNDKLYAIGGGVVQDLVSFTSSILYRGVDWIFFPTTLLAQCDSCIGSKTSINHNGAKNILGGFHPPRNIFIYQGFLKTLPVSEIKSGIGEMLHYFLLNKLIYLSAKMVDDENILEDINTYTVQSLSIKKAMIEKDEFDQNERNLFNYGHTFGHALEKVTGYQINHGQAVTFGMRIANMISLKKGLIDRSDYESFNTILIKNMPDINSYDIDLDQYIGALKKDKKNVSDKLTCILLTKVYANKYEVDYNLVETIVKLMLGK